MRKQFWAGVVVALAVGSNGPLGTRPAAAQDSVSLAALQGQILQFQRQQQAQMRRLQAQLTKLQAESAARDTVMSVNMVEIRVGLRWRRIMRRRWKSGWQLPLLAAV